METIYKKMRLILMALLVLVSSSVWAAFIRNVPQTLNQPDGKVINIFASGDEYYNWLHDADNFTIIKNQSTGYYVYAVKVNGRVAPSDYIVGKTNPKSVGLTAGVLDDDSYIRSKVSEKKDVQNKAKSRFKTAAAASAQVRPAVGLYNNIVVYIEFSDQNGDALTRAEAEGKFNGTGIVSVKDYYNEVSAGQLNVTSSFYPTSTGTYPVYYKDSHPRSYYCKNTPDGYGEDGTESMNREHTLLKNAITAISSQVPTSLNIDGNNDGFVDNVTFVFNGYTEGWAELLWPHRWALFSQTATIGSKQVYDYNTVFTAALGVGVISHEMFHSFGAPDLYQYSAWSPITPVGQWDVMAGTDWNLPQHMTVYLKARYGTWTTIPEITTNGTYTLTAVAASPFSAYKIKLPNSAEGEYIVLEYRKKDGKYEPATYGADGLLIYRVNESGYNAGGPKHEVYVYRKDGSLTVEGDMGNATFHQDRSLTTFNDNTNPSSFLGTGQAGGLLAGSGISNVNVSGNTLTFTYTSPTGGGCTDPVWSPTATYTTGMKVSYNGRKYTANYWTLNNRPDLNCCAAGEEWTDNGPCSSNAAPTVSITSPYNNSNVVVGSSVTISAQANDTDGTISKVDFLNASNTVVYTDNTAPFTYPIGSSLAIGSYTYKAIAYDNLNAASTAATVNFNVISASSVPVVTINSPVANQVIYHYPSDGNQVAVNISTTPAVLDSVLYIVVETTCNGPGCTVVRRFTKVTSPYSLSYSPTYNANGWTQVIAYGFLNGVSSSETSVTFYVKPLPEVAIVSPAPNTNFPRSTTVVPIDVTVNNNQVAIDSVVYSITDVKVTGQTGIITERKFVVASGTFDLNLPVLADQSYSNIHVLAYGDGGKFSKVASIQVFYNDLPTIVITAPLPVNGINPKYLVGGSKTVSANVTDADGTITKVEFTHGNNLGLVTVTTPPYSATFTNLPAPAPDGSYWFTVKAYDNRGGISTEIVSVFKNRVPSVSITSPASNATFTAGSNITVNTLVYDPDFTSGKVEFFNGATKLGEVTSSPFNFTITNAAAGNYALTAKVTDDMGESGVSTVVNISVTGGCAAPQYVANGGYVAGSRVKNNGTQYECKGYPYTAWCNGAAWAYAPGTGSYWTDAWIQIGACREGKFETINENALVMYPNPASQSVNVNYTAENAGEITISIINELSKVEVVRTESIAVGDNQLSLDLSVLDRGIYFLRIEQEGKIITKKLSVVK